MVQSIFGVIFTIVIVEVVFIYSMSSVVYSVA